MVKLTKRDIIFISILVLLIILVSIILSFGVSTKERFGNNNVITLNYADIGDKGTHLKVSDWNIVANNIAKQYKDGHSFLIVTNKSSICYLASALSFILEGNNKPVVLTLKSDFNQAYKYATKTKIPEVMIFSNGVAFRGNRCKLASNGNISSIPDAMLSDKNNLGITKEYFKPMYVNESLRIGIIKLYPGMTGQDLEAMTQNLDGVIIESYDISITPMETDWVNTIREISETKPVIIVSSYPHSPPELDSVYVEGIIDGKDITSETAMVKLYFLMSNIEDKSMIPTVFEQVFRGESRPSYKAEPVM